MEVVWISRDDAKDFFDSYLSTDFTSSLNFFFSTPAKSKLYEPCVLVGQGCCASRGIRFWTFLSRREKKEGLYNGDGTHMLPCKRGGAVDGGEGKKGRWFGKAWNIPNVGVRNFCSREDDPLGIESAMEEKR